MSSMSMELARQHVKLITGDEDNFMHWQTFFDDDTGVDNFNEPKHFIAPINDCREYFDYVQQQNYGVFFTVNKTDGKDRKIENIVGYRAIFADVDGDELPESPIKPTVITQRDSTHSHIYYRVEGVVTELQWKRLQKRIQLFFNSDPNVVDSARVMRLAGTYNLKDPANPAQYVIHSHDENAVYTQDDIEAAFPLSAEKITELEDWCESRNSLTTGEGFNDSPIYRQRLVKWLQRAEPAVEGQNGNATLLRVAGMGL